VNWSSLKTAEEDSWGEKRKEKAFLGDLRKKKKKNLARRERTRGERETTATLQKEGDVEACQKEATASFLDEELPLNEKKEKGDKLHSRKFRRWD